MTLSMLWLLGCNTPDQTPSKDTALEESSDTANLATEPAEEDAPVDTADSDSDSSFCGDGELQPELGEACDDGRWCEESQ